MITRKAQSSRIVADVGTQSPRFEDIAMIEFAMLWLKIYLRGVETETCLNRI